MFIAEDSAYETVVVVRKNLTSGGFQNLESSIYCHPGFKFNGVVTNYLLKEFEKTVLEKNNVDICAYKNDKLTLFEREIKGVAQFFGPSCRPGPWSDKPDLNDYLRK